MKRKAIYLDPDLEVLLKLEATRRGKPVDELLREALRTYLREVPRQPPPGAGAFESGISDTAERNEQVLEELGFGRGKP
ncbi:MAG TPA: CopG family transcriptional regulator [Thermoanaerobaculia bacterium]|nr:CopG family transcriptional regulator [Thermoanaerobaculia bacterium]